MFSTVSQKHCLVSMRISSEKGFSEIFNGLDQLLYFYLLLVLEAESFTMMAEVDIKIW